MNVDTDKKQAKILSQINIIGSRLSYIITVELDIMLYQSKHQPLNQEKYGWILLVKFKNITLSLIKIINNGRLKCLDRTSSISPFNSNISIQPIEKLHGINLQLHKAGEIWLRAHLEVILIMLLDGMILK
jgi:hypothetical protein